MPEREQWWSRTGWNKQEVSRGMARAEGTFRVQGPPRLDDASSWSNYKKRLANLKACKMSEMHMGALVAMSMTSVDNTQVYSYSSFVCFMCCFRVHLLPSQQVPLGTRKLEAKSQQQFISWCVLDCKYIRKVQWCVLSVHFFLWLKMPSRELSFWPPPLIFLKMVSFTSLSREV